MTYCDITRNQHCNFKYTHQHHQLCPSKVVIQRKTRRSQKKKKIIPIIHMLSLPGNRTLYGIFPIINIQHSLWITITTDGTHHNPTTKDAPNTKIINPNWILLGTCSTIIPTRKKYCPKHPTMWCRRGNQGIHKWRTPRLLPHRNLKHVTLGSFL